VYFPEILTSNFPNNSSTSSSVESSCVLSDCFVVVEEVEIGLILTEIDVDGVGISSE
jgi:hypothetical protein